MPRSALASERTGVRCVEDVEGGGGASEGRAAFVFGVSDAVGSSGGAGFGVAPALAAGLDDAGSAAGSAATPFT